MNQFDDLTRLNAEWIALQPLRSEDESRLWRKLKLEWNYHSNHIEGNTLTYGETELLLLHGQVSGNHALRDYVEVQAHDVAVLHLRKLVEDSDRRLSEIDVRDLNRILLKESFWKEAITPDGLPTRIEIRPGEYKELPNNVRTASGEIFRFADPVDVPVKMSVLLAELHEQLSLGELHPIEIVAQLHHEFVLIHPFGDGNGRTARLLVNYVLMRTGYLPLIVPTEKKDSYLAALRFADAGDIFPLTSFLAECAEVALRRGIRAAKGESIEDDGDLRKEIEVFKKRQKNKAREVLAKSPEVIQRTYEGSLRPFFQKFFEELGILDSLFHHSVVAINNVAVSGPPLEVTDKWVASSGDETGNELVIEYRWTGFLGDADEPFSESCRLVVSFRELDYLVEARGSQMVKHVYSIPLLEGEQSQICREALNHLFQRIKEKTREVAE